MQKRQEIELLRIISAFGIVWFHSGVMGSELAYGGLVVFLVLSSYLVGCSNQPNVKYISLRAKRLLLPWLVWFTIYGAINVLIGKSIVPLNNGIIAGILTGPSIHLWYLPFLFVGLVAFDFIRMRATPSFLASASAALVITLLVAVSVWRFKSLQMGPPFSQYAHALAGFFLGIFFAYYQALRNNIVLLFIIIAASMSAFSFPGIGIPYSIGVAAGCIITLLHGVKLPLMGVESLSQYMFGVYLIHPLFLRAFGKFLTIQGLMVPFAVFILSTIIVCLINKISPRVAKFCF